MAQIKAGVLLFLGLIFAYITHIQLSGGDKLPGNTLLYLILAMFLFLGNMMGKIRPNYFLGVRTPWTLESETVWTRTHRLAGRLWVGCSLALMAVLWAVPTETAGAVFAPVVILMAGIPVVASWWFSRQEKS